MLLSSEAVVLVLLLALLETAEIHRLLQQSPLPMVGEAAMAALSLLLVAPVERPQDLACATSPADMAAMEIARHRPFRVAMALADHLAAADALVQVVVSQVSHPVLAVAAHGVVLVPVAQVRRVLF